MPNPDPAKELVNLTLSVQPVYPLYGWVCPRCGRGNAPGTMTCPCVPPPPLVVTCGSPKVVFVLDSLNPSVKNRVQPTLESLGSQFGMGIVDYWDLDGVRVLPGKMLSTVRISEVEPHSLRHDGYGKIALEDHLETKPDPDPNSTDPMVRLFWLLQKGPVQLERVSTGLSYPDFRATCLGKSASSCSLGHTLTLLVKELAILKSAGVD